MDPRSKVPIRLLIGALVIDFIIVAAYGAVLPAVAKHTVWSRVFDLSYEANPPTWWSAVQLLLVALVLLVVASRPFGEHPSIKTIRSAVFGMGVLFLAFSLDEGGQLHERVTMFLGRRWYLPGHGSIAWLVAWVLALLILVGLVIYVPRVWRLWPKETLMIAGGIALILLGGIALELFYRVWHLTGDTELIETGFEEFLELVGASLALYGAARVLTRVAGELFPKAAMSREGTADPETPEV